MIGDLFDMIDDLFNDPWGTFQDVMLFMSEGLPDLSLLRFKPEPRWAQVTVEQPVLVWWGWREGLTGLKITRPPPARGIPR